MENQPKKPAKKRKPRPTRADRMRTMFDNALKTIQEIKLGKQNSEQQ